MFIVPWLVTLLSIVILILVYWQYSWEQKTRLKLSKKEALQPQGFMRWFLIIAVLLLFGFSLWAQSDMTNHGF